MKILIICTGNSCRSQMAEGYVRSIAPASWQVFSAGTRPELKVNPYAVRAMAEIGIDISAHRPKSVNEFVETDFDFVITVCGGANENCPVFSGQVHHKLHIGFEDPADATGTEEEKLNVYRKVRDEIAVEFREFVDRVLYQELYSKDENAD